MKYVLRLALVALALAGVQLALPSAASAAGCFWVGGTGTWDNTNTGGGGTGGIKWASASGGGTACAATSGPASGVPGPSDTATFDGSSGGGTVTMNGTYSGCTGSANICLTSMTTSAFTGTIDNTVNNNKFYASSLGTSWTDSNSGSHVVKLGSGTWTLAGTAGFSGTSSIVAGTSTFVFSGAWNQQISTGTGTAFYNLTLGPNLGSLNVIVGYGGGVAGTSVTNILNITGSNYIITIPTSSSTINSITGGGTAFNAAPIIESAAPTNGAQGTISLTNASSISWVTMVSMHFTTSTLTATNSFDAGNNTGTAITGPSGGGRGIIGG